MLSRPASIDLDVNPARIYFYSSTLGVSAACLAFVFLCLGQAREASRDSPGREQEQEAVFPFVVEAETRKNGGRIGEQEVAFS